MKNGATLAVIGMLILCACSTATAQPPSVTTNEGLIVIAADFPLSGPYRSSGLETLNGARFAVGRVGKIGRFRLVFTAFDDTLAGFQDPVKGVQDVEAMTADAHVLGMVGPFNSAEAFTEIPVASQSELAMVSPTTTSDCLTLKRIDCIPPDRPGGVNNFFRIAAFDTDQGKAMAHYAVKELHLSRVAVLSDGHPYGENLARSFSAELPAVGGTVVLREQLQPSSYDFSDLLQRIKAQGAQAVYVGGAPTYGVCRIRTQMQAIMPGAFFLGGDALLDRSCVADAGSGANDRMIATIAEGRPASDAETTRLVANYTKTYQSIGGYTFAAYDATNVLMDAIRRAVDGDGGKFPSRLDVTEQLASTHLNGVTGVWSFDANGDATAPAISFFHVERGGWTFLKSLTVAASG